MVNNNILDAPVPEINVIINEKSFRIHPVYDLYGSSEDGLFTHVVLQNPRYGNKRHDGYLQFKVRRRMEMKWKMYQSHRFIWECYNGVINDGRVIDHINDKKDDNRLCNLQLITQQQNCKKAGYSYSNIGNRKHSRCVKAVNCTDNTETFYNSIYAVGQHLAVHKETVRKVCLGMKYRKSGISKKDGCNYKFSYISKEELPENYIKSSGKHKKERKKKDKQE
jgi:predicted Zn-ribbon and HTH transcriptional regulator